MLEIGFVSLFPELLRPYFEGSILGRAVQAGRARFSFSNPRDYATDRHRTVDDKPYGGGPGMVMMAPLVAQAIEGLGFPPGAAVVLTDPAGKPFRQSDAEGLSRLDHVAIVCGHYEGVDERVRTKLATHCFSIGDFVLTGGELPALMIADAAVRLREGVLGDPESHRDDSHSDGLLGFPLYTKPPEFLGEAVPPVLLGGNHAEIAKWRRRQQILRTRAERPDLFAKAELKAGDIGLLG